MQGVPVKKKQNRGTRQAQEFLFQPPATLGLGPE
jgi:hypothetical protein